MAAPDFRCAICQTPIAGEEPRYDCPECRAPYHADCWKENGGCAVYGCSKVPRTEARGALEIPPAYWGQSDKRCPSCGASILAAAVRCRHCGATFESQRPQERGEYQRWDALRREQPALKRSVITLFVLSLMPCTAPIASVAVPVWVASRRERVDSLPGLYGALINVGMWVAVAQTVVAMVAAGLYAFLGTGGS